MPDNLCREPKYSVHADSFLSGMQSQKQWSMKCKQVADSCWQAPLVCHAPDDTVECKLSPEAYYCSSLFFLILSLIGNCVVGVCKWVSCMIWNASLFLPCYLIWWDKLNWILVLSLVRPCLYLAYQDVKSQHSNEQVTLLNAERGEVVRGRGVQSISSVTIESCTMFSPFNYWSLSVRLRYFIFLVLPFVYFSSSEMFEYLMLTKISCWKCSFKKIEKGIHSF